MCILLNVSSAADAAEVAAKVTRRIAEPYDFNGIKPVIGSSVGIAMYPEHGTTADALLKYADDSMYRTKRNTPPMNRGVSR
jgi:GGDEF domain-containing protein